VDSRAGCAQHHDVRHRFDADSLSAAAVGEEVAAELLCCEYIAAAAGTGSACVRAGDVEPQHKAAAACDQLPNPTDARALRVADVLLANPGEQHTLTQVCKIAGAGRRTIERRFLEETGMTFGRWRQQLRLMQAMRLLAEGAKITYAALEAGYSTPSAFIFMFRKTLGTTPSAYFRAGAGLENHPRRASGARKG
jgi:AraC-like DNA-binding protein